MFGVLVITSNHFLYKGACNEVVLDRWFVSSSSCRWILPYGSSPQIFWCYTFCLQNYICHMYHVIHKQKTLSKATIHLGNHDHFVVDGVDKDSLQKITILVQGKKSCTLNINNFCDCIDRQKKVLSSTTIQWWWWCTNHYAKTWQIWLHSWLGL